MCMALVIDFCVWHICFYIYLCAFAAMEPANLEKKIWATIRRGHCRRRRGDHSGSDKPYAEGQAVGTGHPLRRGQCHRRMP
jgi:hypothetical protein